MKRWMLSLFPKVMLILTCGMALNGRAQTLDESLAQCAKSLSKQIATAGLKRVGVPEMTNGAIDQLGGNTGAAGHYFAARLADELAKAGNGAFEVVERNRLNRVLQEGKFEATGLTDPKTSQELLGKIPGLDGLVDGTLTRFDVTHTLEVSCRIIRYPDAINKGAAMVKIEMDPDLLGLFGASAVLRQPPKEERARREQLVETATGPQPPRPDPDAPFALEILVNGRPLPRYYRDGQSYVPAVQGDVYQIRLTNRTPGRVAVALFIDGLNTIAQRRELASSAVKWVIGPRQSVVVPGWQIDLQTSRQFVFVTAGESLAARKRFTEEIGLITATVYPEIATSEETRGLGTGEGEEIEHQVHEVSFRASPVPLAILALRYDAREIVERYERVQP